MSNYSRIIIITVLATEFKLLRTKFTKLFLVCYSVHCKLSVYTQRLSRVNLYCETGHGRLGRLAAWHLPGGPVGPTSRWVATSNVEVGQRLTQLTGEV